MLMHGSGKSKLAILDMQADEKDQHAGEPLKGKPLFWKALPKKVLNETLTATLYKHGETIEAEETKVRAKEFLSIAKAKGIKSIITVGMPTLAQVSPIHGESRMLVGSTIKSDDVYITPIDTPKSGIRAFRAYTWQQAFQKFIQSGLTLANGGDTIFSFTRIVTGSGKDAEAALEQILDEKLPVGNDVETSGKDFRTDRITAFALGNANVSVSVPWHTYTSRMYGPQPGLQSARIRTLVEHILNSKDITKLFHNGMFDMSVLATHGIRIDGPTEDTMLAHKIVYPDLFHNLQFCMANEFCIDPWKSRFQQLRTKRGEPTDNWEETDPGPLFLYNAQDAAVEVPLWNRLSTLLDGVHRGWENYERLKQIAEGAADMQFHGVRIDQAAATRTRNSAEVRIKAIEQKWNTLVCSVPVKSLRLNKALTKTIEKMNLKRVAVEMSGVGSKETISALLFKELKAPVVTRSQKTDEAGLGSFALLEYAWMKETNPRLAEVAFTLFEYRKITKSYNAFLKPLTQDRVFAKPQVAGTRGTRFSYSEPNLQQWSKEKEIINPLTGKTIVLAENLRNIVLPDEGMWLIETDYAALEVRLVAYAARVNEWFVWLENKIDLHLEHAKRMFKKDLDKKHPLRQITKVLTFARLYNSKKSVGQVLKALKPSMPTLTKAFLEEVFARFDEARPEVLQWQIDVEKSVRQLGYVELTTSGVRQFHEKNWPDVNAALSFGIQSVGGDVINNAFLRILPQLKQFEGARILFQVHDALLYQAKKEDVKAVAEIVEREMSAPVMLWGQLADKLLTETKVGSNWKDMEDLHKWLKSN